MLEMGSGEAIRAALPLVQTHASTLHVIARSHRDASRIEKLRDSYVQVLGLWSL